MASFRATVIFDCDPFGRPAPGRAPPFLYLPSISRLILSGSIEGHTHPTTTFRRCREGAHVVCLLFVVCCLLFVVCLLFDGSTARVSQRRRKTWVGVSGHQRPDNHGATAQAVNEFQLVGTAGLVPRLCRGR